MWVRRAAATRGMEPDASRSPDLAAASTGELVTRLSEQVSELVKGELELARTELATKARRAGAGAGLMSAGGLLGCPGCGSTESLARWHCGLGAGRRADNGLLAVRWIRRPRVRHCGDCLFPDGQPVRRRRSTDARRGSPRRSCDRDRGGIRRGDVRRGRAHHAGYNLVLVAGYNLVQPDVPGRGWATWARGPSCEGWRLRVALTHGVGGWSGVDRSGAGERRGSPWLRWAGAGGPFGRSSTWATAPVLGRVRTLRPITGLPSMQML